MTAVTFSSHSACTSGQHSTQHMPTASSASKTVSSPRSRSSIAAADSDSTPLRDHLGPTTSSSTANGSSVAMPSRLGSSGPTYAARAPEFAKGRPRTATDERESVDLDRRPLTAPGVKLQIPSASSRDDSDHDRPKRVISKPPLLRSKSEHIVRRDDADQTDEEIYEWGARHGFEDHYQSEDIISQLANVSYIVSRAPCVPLPRITYYSSQPCISVALLVRGYLPILL